MKIPTSNRMPRTRAGFLRATKDLQGYNAWLADLAERAEAGDPKATAQRERHVMQLLALERAKQKGGRK
jgi:hypothetical protein